MKTTNTKKYNQNKTKTNYQKTILKTKKRSLRFRHKHDTGTSKTKRFHKHKATTLSSIKGKRKIKNWFINKPKRLYNWNQPIRHIECYTLTVLQNKTWSNKTQISTITRYSHFLLNHKMISPEDKYNFIIT